MQEVGGSIPLTSTNFFKDIPMEFLTVRPDPADTARLAALYRECRCQTDMQIVPEYFQALPDYVFTEKWDSLFGEPHNYRAKLAIVDDAWAGFYIVGPRDDYSENLHDHTLPEKCGELHQLYLLPAYQAKGIGKSLYEQARQDFKELGHQTFIACTYLENENAKGFYKSIGAQHLKDDVLGAPWHRPVTFFLDRV